MQENNLESNQCCRCKGNFPQGLSNTVETNILFDRILLIIKKWKSETINDDFK